MALWGSLDASNNAPKQSSTSGYGGNTPQVTTNSQVYFANTKISSFIGGAAIGVFGVDASEQAAATAATGHGSHAGWNLRKVGTGPVVTITANSGSVAVNSYITFSQGNGIAGSGNTAANAWINVNTDGSVKNVQILSAGVYANTPIATANQGNTSLTVTMGGRANRVQVETLVALGGSMTGDGDSVF
jgi:hypothetical protein